MKIIFDKKKADSGEIQKFKSGTLEEIFWRTFWGGKWTHILNVKPLNERFIIPLISFSSLLVSNFLKICMVLSILLSYPSHMMCMKDENNKE